MMMPINKLTKILNLEAEKHQDRAVFGGLTRYADTWLQEAESIFGPDAGEWVQKVAGQLRAYSTLTGSSARQETLNRLLEMLQAAPSPHPSSPPQQEEEKEKTAPAPPKAKPVSSYAHTDLESPVTALRGVGPTQAKRLAKLGVQAIRDVLYCFPRHHEDYSQLKPINRLEYGEEITLIAQVQDAGARKTRGGGTIFKATLSDGTGSIEATWFNQPFLADKIQRGRQLVVSGRVDEYLGRLCFNSPEWELLDKELLHTARLVPIYPLTKGIGAKWMRRLVKRTADYWSRRLPDHLPASVRQEADLLDLETAIVQIHFPDDKKMLKRAYHRLAFDELFVLQIGLLRRRHQWRSEPGKPLPVEDGALDDFLGGLSFELTGAQERALRQIVADLRSEQPMNRLLQADVGAGKTAVGGRRPDTCAKPGR